MSPKGDYFEFIQALCRIRPIEEESDGSELKRYSMIPK